MSMRRAAGPCAPCMAKRARSPQLPGMVRASRTAARTEDAGAGETRAVDGGCQMQMDTGARASYAWGPPAGMRDGNVRGVEVLGRRTRKMMGEGRAGAGTGYGGLQGTVGCEINGGDD